MERRVDTPLGPMCLVEEDGALTRFYRGGCGTDDSPLLREAERQLRAYFRGERRTFELPLAPHGTAFQKAVWAALLEIPYGETRSYAEIAAKTGKPRACRAVGMANKRNPLPVFIPCHRVIGADGSLTGYAGGLEIKAALLALESQQNTD